MRNGKTCKTCRFAIGKREYWIPAKEGTKLQKSQNEAYQKGGIVCSGNLKAVVDKKELNKKVENCEMYQKGVQMFG